MKPQHPTDPSVLRLGIYCDRRDPDYRRPQSPDEQPRPVSI
jgi:hypothetical protein